MNMSEILSSINVWAVLVAALSAFVVGWLWYGPLFGKQWMKLNGFTEEMLREGGGMSMPLIMIINYIATALAAFAIAMFIGSEADMHFGIFAGFMIALFWIGTSRLNDVLYERKPFKLYLINVGYYLVIYIIMGAVLGAWH
ncbi:DUF1761 domain-containing protein [Maribellus sp. CM-23]|uniref:DUF1761 domain-containing protein n=1 Tax=Maribellus luteus TaxID=2305463 RepID=A0A399T5Q7_9BACT|nr:MULTISPECIES: DUF1761 domain-containing protein [Maribellus]MCE4563457.1 DUF1761 domain-containing protein [Maribellus sp. CM-23]RIJ49223.1 DUF1761 domain-containing protein [Maribellus luteus]